MAQEISRALVFLVIWNVACFSVFWESVFCMLAFCCCVAAVSSHILLVVLALGFGRFWGLCGVAESSKNKSSTATKMKTRENKSARYFCGRWRPSETTQCGQNFWEEHQQALMLYRPKYALLPNLNQACLS